MAITISPEITALIRRLEAGVKADGRFKHVANPKLVIELDGVTAEITIRTGRMRKPVVLKKFAETAEEAVDRLLDGLDSTYEVYSNPL